MATAEDWRTRVARVKEQVEITLPNLVTNYEMKDKVLGDLLNEMGKLEDVKSQIEYEIVKTEQEASTADRDFIEKKETFPDPFKPSKIYTVQDFTFYIFFISYCIFIVALSMVFQQKIKTFVIGIIVLFMLIALMYRYA